MKKITIEYRVPYADTDMMGVVYYGNYLICRKWRTHKRVEMPKC